MALSLSDIRCRQIEETDIDAVAALLTRGFPSRGDQFWRHALDQLTRRDPPEGLPKYGYLLESAGAPVGVILLICAAMPAHGTFSPRCNLSSWYVEPAFRAYAPMLVSQALRHKEVTYTNVSAAPHTWPIIEAQGFRRYSDGIFVALPALTPFGGEKASVIDAKRPPAIDVRSVRAADAARSTPRMAASACGARPKIAPIRSCSGRGWSKVSCPARS